MTPTPPGLPPATLARVLTHIERQLPAHMTVGDLALVARRSPSNFAHLFRQAMGVTPAVYVWRRRLLGAVWLLTYTRLSLIEISLEIGCCDQSQFTARFRRAHGRTPKQYRREADWRPGTRRHEEARDGTHEAIHLPTLWPAGAQRLLHRAPLLRSLPAAL